MLNNQTLETLHQLKLAGMAQAYAQQLEQPAAHDLSFDERLALLVGAETTERDNRKQIRLLRLAHLRQSNACVEDIDYRHPRGLERSRMAALVTGDFIRQRQNLHITGPTGTGKSWLACALGQAACRQGLPVRYERVPRLLENLRLSKGDGSYGKKLQQIAKIDLLILDDFGLKPLTRPGKARSAGNHRRPSRTALDAGSPVNCRSKRGTNIWAIRRWRMRCSTGCSTTRTDWSCAAKVCERTAATLT